MCLYVSVFLCISMCAFCLYKYRLDLLFPICLGGKKHLPGISKKRITLINYSKGRDGLSFLLYFTLYPDYPCSFATILPCI